MYYVAKVMGQIFANPPYFILRCIVASERSTQPWVVKGKIAGRISKGSVFTFHGKEVLDKKNGKYNLEVVRSPINPRHLKGSALTNWADWSDPFMEASVDLASTLAEAGVPLATINAIWNDLEMSPMALKENPWSLIYQGVTFNGADEVARTLLGDKYDPESPMRIEASIFWSMLQGVYQGHCYLDSNTIFKDTAILTGVSNPLEIAKVIKGMVEAVPARMVIETCGEDSGDKKSKALFLPSYHRMETDVASLITSPLRANPEVNITDDEIRSYTRYGLTDKQVQAIRQGLSEPFSIVTGLPGTGKTTILNTLCKILKDRHESILLVAPTGIAAKRASSLTGLEALTIHRAFGAGQPSDDKAEKSDYEGVKKAEEDDPKLKPAFGASDPSREVWKHGVGEPRTESVIIVDEASMVDLHLMWRMMRGISPKCRVIMVGDIAQLPPVGAGFVLSELIASGKLPRVHLTEIFRQGKGSGVTIAAHKIHAGEVPHPDEDYQFIDRYTTDDILDTLVSVCKDLQMDEVDFHVMSPTHHGKVGVTNLNRELRGALNPSIEGERSIRLGNDTIRVNDRVMITRNEYDLNVFNGDIGRIISIDPESVDVRLSGVKDQVVSIPKDAISKLLRLAYATTVHKSQGLEYDTIVMPMTSEHSSILLQRSLLYTAVTRASGKVILIGDRDAVAICVGNASSGIRYSRLSERF
jgi:exodeoxyribonuclease V alpha subunit